MSGERVPHPVEETGAERIRRVRVLRGHGRSRQVSENENDRRKAKRKRQKASRKANR